MVVSGVGPELASALADAGVPDEGESRVETLAEGVEALLRAAGGRGGASRGFAAWLRGLLVRRPRAR